MRKALAKVSQFLKQRPEFICAIQVGAWIYYAQHYLRMENPSKWSVAGCCLMLGLTFAELVGIYIMRAKIVKAVIDAINKLDDQLKQRAKDLVHHNMRMAGINPEAVQEALAEAKKDHEEELKYERDLQREREEKLKNLKPGSGNAVAIGGWGWNDPSKK